MRAGGEVFERFGRGFEGEHLIDHGPDPGLGKRSIQSLEHFPAANVNPKNCGTLGDYREDFCLSFAP